MKELGTRGMIPASGDRKAAEETLDIIRELRRAFDAAGAANAAPEALHAIRDLAKAAPGTGAFLAQTLGAGEVRIHLCGPEAVVEEAEIPGVWRLDVGGQSSVVASLLPRTVCAFIGRGAEELVETGEAPAGLFAAPAILSEVREALRALKDDPSLVREIDLLRQPLGPADMNYILATIGRGSVTVELRGFARSRIESTRVRGLWHSRIVNDAGRALLDSLVVARIPPEVPAGADDIPGSSAKLAELEEWIASDLRHGVFD